MTFTKPCVGPKVYLSRGPSGHAETFPRQISDHTLVVFLGKVTVPMAIDHFLRKMRRERRLAQWSDVIDFLALATGVVADLVPAAAAVSFWAQAEATREESRVAANVN